MKKIFKHLRENWIQYIFETLAVLLGVLAAFSLNNWNESRKSRILEREYLADVHVEFINNKKQLDVIMAAYRDQLAYADSTMEMMPITEENWNQVHPIYVRAFNVGSFDPSSSSINGLINSGKIDLVQNDSLKKLLLLWTDQFEDYKEEERRLESSFDIFAEIYLNESTFPINEISIPLADELNIKLEKMLIIRQVYLRIVLSDMPGQNESQRLMESIEAIISLTEPYMGDR